MEILNLTQPPVISADVESLIKFWNAGFAAARANMTYVVETRMNLDEFIDVAKAQLPLLKLIQGELYDFSHLGWGAIPDYVLFAHDLSERDEERLALFRHDVASHEGLFSTMVSLNGRNPANFKKWYKEAQYLYKKRLSLKGMIRGLCYNFHTAASREGISLHSDVSNNACLRIPCFDPAKAIFNNLLSNAIKYGRRGGSVRIWDDGYSIFFQDDGHGMSPDFAAKLGQGNRIREERVKGPVGEGLGWKSIDETARKLGWEWEIKSDIEEGTTVRIIMHRNHFVKPGLRTIDINELKSLPKRPTVDLLLAGAKIFNDALPFDGYMPDTPETFSVADSPIYKSIEYARRLMLKC